MQLQTLSYSNWSPPLENLRGCSMRTVAAWVAEMTRMSPSSSPHTSRPNKDRYTAQLRVGGATLPDEYWRVVWREYDKMCNTHVHVHTCTYVLHTCTYIHVHVYLYYACVCMLYMYVLIWHMHMHIHVHVRILMLYMYTYTYMYVRMYIHVHDVYT